MRRDNKGQELRKDSVHCVPPGPSGTPSQELSWTGRLHHVEDVSECRLLAYGLVGVGKPRTCFDPFHNVLHGTTYSVSDHTIGVTGSVSPLYSKVHTSYHIPRFILRTFQTGGSQKGVADRKKNFPQNKGAIDENVLVYSMKTGLLDTRPISTVYGVTNLYKDVRNAEDVHEIEKKLSVLESRASRAVSTILAATGTSSCKLIRKNLIDLRKFLFIMHYRSSRLSGEYFKERSDPFHLPSLEWLQAYKKRHGLESDTEMWLHTLRYYLDTPHKELMQHGGDILLKYGDKILEILSTRIDPDEEHFNALAYQGLAGGCFLCIWEVADGEEFILGDSSFGLWEGSAAGHPGLHHLFVLSPHIIIVLSMQFLRPEYFSQLSEEKKDSFFSTLMDIKHVSPLPTYPGGAPKNQEELAAIVAREEDIFEFKIIKLSVPQSREINAIILQNLPESGSVTFVSKTSMLRTLRSFWLDFLNINRLGYVPLLRFLSEDSPEGTDIGFMKAKSESEAPADFMLWVTATKVLSGERAYRSQYDRAVVFFLLVKSTRPPTGSLCEEYSRILSSIMDGYRRLSHPGPLSAAVPQKGELVRSLSKANSDRLFQFMEKWLRNLSVMKPDIAMAALMYEAAIIGFLDWLVKHQPKFVMAATLSAQLTVPILED